MGFLEVVLTKIGFGKKWVEWTMECVKTISYNLVINGLPSSRVNPSRGLRQRDPLSPYLFLFVSDVLSRMILAEVNAHNVKGLVINKNCPVLSHLFFADDSLLFMEAEEQNCKKVMQIIEDYGMTSGQKLNLEKTRMMFSTNVKEEVKRKIAEGLRVEEVENPETYLGIPAMWGKKKTVAMAFLKEKVQEKVQH